MVYFWYLIFKVVQYAWFLSYFKMHLFLLCIIFKVLWKFWTEIMYLNKKTLYGHLLVKCLTKRNNESGSVYLFYYVFFLILYLFYYLLTSFSALCKTESVIFLCTVHYTWYLFAIKWKTETFIYLYYSYMLTYDNWV